jgi:hypothetical protein
MPSVSCPGCGREVSTSAVTCDHCGRSLDDATGRPPVAQAMPPQPVPLEPKSEGIAFKYGCAVLLVALVSAALWAGLALIWPLLD